MTTKEWLSRGWKLNETINKKLEAQYKAYNLACSATAHGSDDRVQTGHKKHNRGHFSKVYRPFERGGQAYG